MIFTMKQEKTNFSMSWKVEEKGSTIAEIEAPFIRGQFIAEIRRGDKVQKLFFNPRDTRFGTGLEERMAFRIHEDNAPVGKMVGRTMRTGRLLGGYPYYEVDYRGEAYSGYEIGLGREGLYQCLYKGDQLIFTAEKALKTVNYQDHYEGYLLDRKDLDVALPFLVYYDVIEYGDLMEVSMGSVKKKVVHTVSKELKAKFDPDFIPKVTALEK